MRIEKIDLYAYFNIKRPDVNAQGYLTTYILDNIVEARLRPAMLVFGGGGYHNVSPREQEPVALKYMEKGYNAFVVQYTTANDCNACFPTQLIEGAMAVAYIKKNAKQLSVDENHVAGIGFSAGGHMCAMMATMFDAPEIKEALKDDAKYTRLDAVVLSYPVITSGEKAHKGSFINLSGNKPELFERLSLEKNVAENSVPAFLWTTGNDPVVPTENTLYMALAYREKGVPFELHVFEKGLCHGLSIATKEVSSIDTPIQAWVSLSLTWLENRGFVINN